jgi:intracellular multiplication protein IcmB
MAMITAFDRLFCGMDSFMRSLSDCFGATVEHNCMLETSYSDTALSTNNSSLATLLEYEGALSQIGKTEYENIINGLNLSLGSIFKKPGRQLQVVYHYDPDSIGKEAEKIFRPARVTARNQKLDLDELLDDWQKTVSTHCAVEKCYLAAWTQPHILSASERRKAYRKMNKTCANTPSAPGKQQAGMLMGDIRHEHEGFIELLMDSFKDQDLILRVMDTHEALWNIRHMICPEFTGPDWRALLPGDSPPRKYSDPGEKEYAGLLYPSIAGQLFPREAESIDRSTIRIGDTLHRPLIVNLPPQNPKPFQRLFRFLAGKRIAYRCAFLIAPDGLSGLWFKNLLCGLLAISNSENKKFKNAYDELHEAALNGETIVTLKLCFDTWVNANQPDALEKLSSNASILAGAIQAWGTCDATESIGDPLLGVCATIPGLMDTSPAPASAPPLRDVIGMIPMRPLSVWKDGSLLLRTPDGKLMPYAPMSSRQTAWIDIGVGPQGVGKSIALSVINLAFCLQPGLQELPWCSILDIGPSSSGLINLIKAALPPGLQYLAGYHRLRMEPRYAINTFDTPLGCRKPLPSHINFLVNLLSLFATPLNESAPREGVTGLARMGIERAYDMLSDHAMPKTYSPVVDQQVTAVVDKLNLRVDENTTWWEIVDDLFDAGCIHEAIRAQRYAVPLLSDINSACHQSEDIQKMYPEIVGSFTRSLSEAIVAYPILKEPTRFDIGDTRLISLDLDEVAPRGGGAAGDRQTAVMYMLGRHVVASRFFQVPADLNLMPERYRQYHSRQIEEMRRSPKRLCCDEVHRVTGNQAVANQFVADLETSSRESRKRNLSIGLYSQHINDYPEIITELATSIVALGVGTQQNARQIAERFGFNDALVNSLQNLGKPGPKGANLVAMFKTAKGSISQTLTNTVAPQALWAFSSTEEDMDIRNMLYERIGIKKALRVLARHWPGGIKAEIERRKIIQEETGGGEKSNIYYQLVEEMVAASRLL